jgi:hypothetical protein
MSDISSHHTGLFVLWNLYNKYLEVDVRQLSINLSLIQLAYSNMLRQVSKALPTCALVAADLLKFRHLWLEYPQGCLKMMNDRLL